MEDLMAQLQAKAGLSQEQAQKAVDVVADFLQNKVSADQLRDIASKIPGIGGQAENIPDDIGESLADKARGLFGKKD